MAGGRVYARGQAGADLQAAGLNALGHLSRELRQTAACTVTPWTGTGVAADCALSFRAPTPSDALIPYQPDARFTVLWHDSQRQLLLEASAAAGVNNRLDPSELGALMAAPPSSPTILAAWVKTLTVNTTPYTVALQLDLAQDLNSTQRTTQTVATTVCLRNQP